MDFSKTKLVSEFNSLTYFLLFHTQMTEHVYSDYAVGMFYPNSDIVMQFPYLK